MRKLQTRKDRKKRQKERLDEKVTNKNKYEEKRSKDKLHEKITKNKRQKEKTERIVQKKKNTLPLNK